MNNFITSWLAAAAEVIAAEFSRPVEVLPGTAIPAGVAHFTLVAELAGDWAGTFAVSTDEAALTALFAALAEVQEFGNDRESEVFGSGDKLSLEAVPEMWQRLFRRICVAAAAKLGVQSGQSCEVATISPAEIAPSAQCEGCQLRAGEAMAPLAIADQVEAKLSAAHLTEPASRTGPARPESDASPLDSAAPHPGADSPRGIDLLLGVELEASLRFGSREMALNDLLALGPGDVIQLDRALADPVDLIVGDKIVASGEVVLVNGNFGLRVTEVAEPRKSLESTRCLF
jgi:flagellar motor switch protein FliN